MVRPASSDFLQNHRFALVEIPGDLDNDIEIDRQEAANIAASSTFVISCQSLTIPTISVDAFTLEEGTEMFTHMINSGRASTSECVLTRAVLPYNNRSFYDWIHRAIYGTGATRKTFDVLHLSPLYEGDLVTEDSGTMAVTRMYRLESCIPTSYRPSSDLSGEDDGISMEEITIQPHRVRLIIPDRT